MGETEVIIPSQSMIDFDLINNAKSSPGYTAPSSPTRIEDYYFSAPASPRHISQFYKDFDEFLNDNIMISDGRRNSVSLTVPFEWEEIPGVPKSAVKNNNMFEDDFAFDVSQEMDTASLSADELFHGGKIRPLELCKSSQSDVLKEEGAIRGRERSVSSLSSSRSGHRATRSLSPMRVSEYPWEEEYQHQQKQQKNDQQNSKQSSSKPNLTSSVSALSSSSLKGHKKWKLKDFFLFRSASEGRATDKVDPLKKYASLFKKHEDIKSSSFRSIHNDPGNSVYSSKRKGKGPVSAHELHYTINRAVSEDLKKKTFLPYKQGILGRLSFNPAVHAIANGFGFSRK